MFEDEDDVNYIGSIPGEYEVEEIYPEKMHLEQVMDRLTCPDIEPISLRKEDYDINQDELSQVKNDDDHQIEPLVSSIDEIVKNDPREFPLFIPDTSKLNNQQLYDFLNVLLDYVSEITTAHMAKRYVCVGSDYNINLCDEKFVFDVLHKVYNAGILLGQFTKLSDNKMMINGFDEAYNFQKYRLPRLIKIYRHHIRAFMLEYGYHITLRLDMECSIHTLIVTVTYDDMIRDKIFRIIHAKEIKFVKELIADRQFYDKLQKEVQEKLS